jgi:hypothetical protein
VIALVTTLLAVVALYGGMAFGLFGHCCPRINANETAAVATLRNLASAQEQFRSAGHDRFGTFGELSAGVPVRGTDRRLDPPVLSPAFRKVLPDGTVKRSGYRFRLDVGKDTWRGFAWPDPQRRGSRRTFFIDGATGKVLATVSESHEGDRGPADETGHVWVEVR